MNNFKKETISKFFKIKEEVLKIKIPIKNEKNKTVAILRPITKKIIKNDNEIYLLAKWREQNSFAFPSQFKVTINGTKLWLINQLLNNPTRMLFFVETKDTHPILIGHMGLYSFDFKENSCEIDNVVRGDKQLLKGIMSLALKELIAWTKKELKPNNIYLRVFYDNISAINYYTKIGFRKLKLIPLKKSVSKNMVIWNEDNRLKKSKKYFLKMILRV